MEIEVPVGQIPEKLHVNINELHLDETLALSAIEDLPEGAKFVADANEPVVNCTTPVELPEEAMEAGAGEPEIIGEREEEEAGEGEED